MTAHVDMRYWPFEENLSGKHITKRVRNGATKAGVRWAVMGQSGYMPGCNGYAQIPWEGHPWSGCTDYNDLEAEVHGGLTYGPLPEFDRGARIHPATTFADCGGWIGFDTMHAGDFWTDEALAEVGLERHEMPGLTWPLGMDCEWTLDKVIKEALFLAGQILAVALAAKFPEHKR